MERFFPNFDDFDMKDFRQAILAGLSYDVYAVRNSAIFINESLEKNISDLLSESMKNVENAYKHSDLMIQVAGLRTVEPFAFSSIVLSIYAIVEYSLDRYCEMCKDKYQINIELFDITDKGIRRAIKYLEKIIKVEPIITGESEEWRLMKLVNDLRNDIIHRNAYISDKKSAKYLELGVEKLDGRLYISFEISIKIIDICYNFIKYVFSKDIGLEEKAYQII